MITEFPGLIGVIMASDESNTNVKLKASGYNNLVICILKDDDEIETNVIAHWFIKNLALLMMNNIKDRRFKSKKLEAWQNILDLY